MPFVERSYIYERVQLDEYYQNIIVTHQDYFWNLTPGPLDGVSGSDIYKFIDQNDKSLMRFELKFTYMVSGFGHSVLS